MKITSTNHSKGGKGCAIAFLSLFLVVGLLVTAILLSSAWERAKTWRWPQAECVILKSRVVEEADEYKVDLLYAYTVDGRQYQGTRRGFDEEKFTHVDEAEDFSRRNAEDTRVACYYDPDQPQNAVLERQSLWFGLFALIPMVFVAIGFYGIRGVLRSGKPVSGAVSERAKLSAGQGRAAVIIFGAIFALVGGLVLWFMSVKPMLQVRAAAGWKETPCTIRSASMKSHRDSDGDTTYRLQIRYAYQFAGEEFRGDRHNFNTGSSSSTKWRKEALAQYKPGSKVVCYVNPNAPWQSVLVREAGPDWWFGLIPGVFLLVGLGIMFGGSKMSGQKPPVPSAPRAALAAPAAGGGVELKPSITPAGKFGCAAIFALIWNAITWSVLFGTNVSGGGKFFLMLFLIIGLLIAAGAVYLFLAMFNPQPVITVEDPEIRLGATVEFRYRLKGSPARLMRLQISMEAHEEATYRRGTDTVTDKSCFAQIIAMDTRDRAAMSSGSVKVTIPADLMHSFEASNNKVKWTLRVRGDVPKWPDIDFEFPLQVLPLKPGTTL